MTTFTVHGPKGSKTFTTAIEANVWARRNGRGLLPCDPRRVGGRYQNGHAGTPYVVDDIQLTARGELISITVTDDRGTRTHGTAWNGSTDRELGVVA